MRLRVLHRDFRRNVLTLEVAGLRRFWTPLVILTCESVVFDEGDVVEVAA